MLSLPSRREVVIGIGAGLVSTAAYGFAIEPRFRLVVTRYAPALPGWTPGLTLRIAVIADIHVGEPWMPLDRAAEIVDATPSVRWRRVPLVELGRVLSGLNAPLGTHAILGNHDWWDDHAAMQARRGPVESQRALEACGIPVLDNDAVRLVKDGRPFWLAGIADQEPFLPLGDRRSLADLPRTLGAVTDDAPVILMVHEPKIFRQVPTRVSLTLAGHTHGGQVRLFGHSPFMPARHGSYVYGHIVENGRHLIVSGGLGVSRVAVRFGVPPEIVLVEPTGAPSAATA